jgi:hypothetical protein
MFLVPIHCLVCVLLPQLLFTRHWTKTVTAFTSCLELTENYFKLNWLRIFPEARYIALAPTAQKTQLYCWLALTAQKTSHTAAVVVWRLTAAEMCLPLRCVAMSNKYLYFYCILHILRFLHFNSSRMGQICHNVMCGKLYRFRMLSLSHRLLKGFSFNFPVNFTCRSLQSPSYEFTPHHDWVLSVMYLLITVFAVSCGSLCTQTADNSFKFFCNKVCVCVFFFFNFHVLNLFVAENWGLK